MVISMASSLAFQATKPLGELSLETILGTWKDTVKVADVQDLTRGTIVLRKEGEKLTGIAVEHLWSQDSGRPKVVGKNEVPMIAPTFNGKEVSFRINQGGEIIELEMKFKAPHEAEVSDLKGEVIANAKFVKEK